MPRGDRTSRRSNAASTARWAGSEPSILVVDDDPLAARALARHLERRADVDVAESKAQAVEAIETSDKCYAAVLQDVCLQPEGRPTDRSGLALARSIRRKDEATELALVTGYDEPDTIATARHLCCPLAIKGSQSRSLHLFIDRVLAGPAPAPTDDSAVLHLCDDARRTVVQHEPEALALSPALRRLLALRLEGFHREGIAEQMGVSVRTYDNHVRRLLRITGYARTAPLVDALLRRANLIVARNALQPGKRSPRSGERRHPAPSDQRIPPSEVLTLHGHYLRTAVEREAIHPAHAPLTAAEKRLLLTHLGNADPDAARRALDLGPHGWGSHVRNILEKTREDSMFALNERLLRETGRALAYMALYW